jgi:hypothetical protein
MILNDKEHAILIRLLSDAIKKELDKSKPNFQQVAYYSNLQLQLNLFKEQNSNGARNISDS